MPFQVLFIRVPYYIGDLKTDPNLENYSFRARGFRVSGSGFGV